MKTVLYLVAVLLLAGAVREFLEGDTLTAIFWLLFGISTKMTIALGYLKDLVEKPAQIVNRQPPYAEELVLR